ncbi:MAG: HAD hydrolase family protein [Candidatus Poribacteria bacterium]
MQRLFATDCEGPISKNDNAFEITKEFIPSGDEFFAKISRYDDLLADIDKKSGYKAGDTLKLILPFLKAFGITDRMIREYSENNILIVPYADYTMRQILSNMPTFIISTSYRPYIDSLCKILSFPIENTFCTELSLDSYEIPKSEMVSIKELYNEILNLPTIEIPPLAKTRADLDKDTLKTIERLDEIFWNEFPKMSAGKLIEDVNPIGGFEKANAVKKICEKTGIHLSEVMYVGDSITDVSAMKLVSDSGGIAISFNGNRYAIQSANIACISPNTLILMELALIFNDAGKQAVLDVIIEWSEDSDIRSIYDQEIILDVINSANMQSLISKSESFRKTIRGESIGHLG